MPLPPYLELMRLPRPIGALLLLWPTLWALWLAGDGGPPGGVLLVFVAGVFVMRAFGCVINDYLDRDIDGHVERTKHRPLATGAVSPRGALICLGLLGALALALWWQLNTAARLWALAGAGLCVFYPLCKRFTHLAQVALGCAFSWSIPIVYAALGSSRWNEAALLFAANLCWVVAYDTQYALVDREDDRTLGLHSTALWFGQHADRAVGTLQLATLGLLAGLGILGDLSWHFFCLLLVAGGFFAYQQWCCRNGGREQYFAAFLNNAWVGGAVFLGVVAAAGLPN